MKQSPAPPAVPIVPITGSRRWYAVQCRPRREETARANLANQGFPPFLPQFPRTVRHARHVRTVLAPVFPGYLFVSLDLARDRWRSIQGTLGVARIVTDGSLPVPVPRGLVEELIAGLDGAGAPAARLDPGDSVRLVTGPFADLVGQLLALDDAGRAAVLLDMLGSRRAVSVAAGSLMPAG